jgi:hypothetical protein
VDIYAATTRVVEYAGKEFGHKLRMLVLYDKGAMFPTLETSATKQDGVKIMMSTSRKQSIRLGPM